jgi:hypothetical protein
VDGIPIFGSVSTTDIAQHLKRRIEHNEEAATIALSGDNIRFIDLKKDADTTKVKALGSYKVEISITGAPQPLSRFVEVVSEDPDKLPELQQERSETG